ncbi:carbohydrate kinase family protein [Lottiidibacillus patelloidae]|nr:carbohydrate kinase family protein [Lottiidibacillus patelloidae]
MMSKVLIIGKVFVDIKGSSFAPPHKDAKNVGNVIFSNGGTGRNVAQNMAVLGTEATFVTSITDDATGRGVITELEKHNVDTSSVHLVDENGMGMWLAVLDNDGDLVTSISHQPDERHLIDAVYLQFEKDLSEYDAIIMDLDMPLEIIDDVTSISNKKQIPIYGLAAHLSEIQKNIKLLSRLTSFICNKEEAEILLHRTISNQEEAITAAKDLAKLGAPLTIVTLSEQGCVYADLNNDEVGHIPTECITVIDSTGAGDAFFSGTVSQLIEGKNLKEAINIGMKSAKRVISCVDNALNEPIFVNK